MFTRLAPQMVRHSSGYVVQIASRQRVERVGQDGSVVAVESDFAPSGTGLYAMSIECTDANGRAKSLSEDEKREMLAQMKAGMEFMGGICEIVYS